ncbi:hypothetical protein ACLB2K_072947 [Fragaria x ananassa]
MYIYWLERPFEEEEFRRAVFECDIDKSPGPDGFSLSALQRYWEVIKKEVFDVLAEIHTTGVVNKVTNETYICLIPKKANSLKVGDYRPISLITSLYKIIAKVLAWRLREVLSDTISCVQDAFIKGRQMLDAVLVANEVVYETRKKKKEGLVFKIDFEEAYDHVEWNLLNYVMESKGFGERWRNWIGGCLRLANFSILINGRPRGKFGASRGLRQGDPLSPFLFTLMVDVLNRLMESAREFNLIEGLGIYLDPSIYLMDDENKTLADVQEKTLDTNHLAANDSKTQMGINSLLYTDHVNSEEGTLSNEVNNVSGYLEAINLAASEKVSGEETDKSSLVNKEKSGPEPIIIPIVLKMAEFDHKALLEEEISTRTFSDKCLVQDKDKLISNLKTIQDYLCSFNSQGLTVVNISATTFPQTLDWLHGYLLECIEHGISSVSNEHSRPAEK